MSQAKKYPLSIKKSGRQRLSNIEALPRNQLLFNSALGFDPVGFELD
jgi:hypothetical protein